MRLEPGSESRSSEGRQRILIVDTDPRVPEALALALRGWAAVTWASSGMEGLTLAAKQAVDLAVVAADIPDVPWTGFLRTLRLLRPGLPVALLGQGAEGEEPEEDGADIRFPRPPDLKALVAWIADRLKAPPRPSRVQSPPVSWGIPPPQPEILRRALELIERHHPAGIPLAMVAQAAGVSRSHLCRMFKRCTGESLKRFLTRRRLQATKELLLLPGMTILEVARRTGFRDASHLDRVFRRWEGLTPSGYRRRAILWAFRNGRPTAGRNHPQTSFLSPP